MPAAAAAVTLPAAAAAAAAVTLPAAAVVGGANARTYRRSAASSQRRDIAAGSVARVALSRSAYRSNRRPAHIGVFDVDVGAGKVSNSKVFAEGFAPGFTDGIRLDVEGNVWTSMGWADPSEDGVRCYASNGDLIGKIHLPETCANLVFGGLLRNRLYRCASTSVYALYVNTQGAALP